MRKWTPGPWVAKSEAVSHGGSYLGFCTGVILDSNGESVARAHGHVHVSFPKDGSELKDPPPSANAHLIAAAPDMADALDDCLHALNIYGDKTGTVMDAIEKAESALKKARGEA